MTRIIMHYVVSSKHTMVVSCRTCRNKRDVGGRDYPVCSIGVMAECRAKKYAYWVFPVELYSEGETVKLLGCQEVKE